MIEFADLLLGSGNAQGISLPGTVVFLFGQTSPIKGIHLKHKLGVVLVIIALAHKSSSGEDEVIQIKKMPKTPDIMHVA